MKNVCVLRTEELLQLIIILVPVTDAVCAFVMSAYLFFVSHVLLFIWLYLLYVFVILFCLATFVYLPLWSLKRELDLSAL